MWSLEIWLNRFQCTFLSRIFWKEFTHVLLCSATLKLLSITYTIYCKGKAILVPHMTAIYIRIYINRFKYLDLKRYFGDSHLWFSWVSALFPHSRTQCQSRTSFWGLKELPWSSGSDPTAGHFLPLGTSHGVQTEVYKCSIYNKMHSERAKCSTQCDQSHKCYKV